MATVYSVNLFGSSFSAVEGDNVSNPMPTGVVWVVRAVNVVAPGPLYGIVPGWSLTDLLRQPIAAAPTAVGMQTWTFDTHQVVPAGSGLIFNSQQLGYGFDVSGYQLTLP